MNTGGNRIALMTSAFSYEIVIDWGTSASTTEAEVHTAINTIVADGQSYLGYGMEAVKAALVQPEHINEAEDVSFYYYLLLFLRGPFRQT